MLLKNLEVLLAHDFFLKDVNNTGANEETDHEQQIGSSETCLIGVTLAQPFVSDCIDMLSAGAAPGPDGIPAKMIKAANSTFASMLNNIMQSSLESGDIPGILKLAFVTPIHKGDSRSDPANFRPVSLTSHLIKFVRSWSATSRATN